MVAVRLPLEGTLRNGPRKLGRYCWMTALTPPLEAQPSVTLSPGRTSIGSAVKLRMAGGAATEVGAGRGGCAVRAGGMVEAGASVGARVTTGSGATLGVGDEVADGEEVAIVGTWPLSAGEAVTPTTGTRSGAVMRSAPELQATSVTRRTRVSRLKYRGSRAHIFIVMLRLWPKIS
jgi:hypothetical protein